MTTTSKTKSHPKEVPFQIYAERFQSNNQQVCIDCLKTKSNTIECECKKCVKNNQLFKFFICSIAQVNV